MLTGEELGAAIESARKLKGVSKKAMAEAFGVAAPSIQDWVRRGTISKSRLPLLWDYFRDVVDAGHWGLASIPARTHDAAGDESTAPQLGWLIEQLGAALVPIDGLARTPLAELLAQLAREPHRAEDIASMAEAIIHSQVKRRAA